MKPFAKRFYTLVIIEDKKTMLAKKHYAQRGNSSGAMKSGAVARSASSVIKRYVTSAEQVYKPVADKTESRYIHELTQEAIKCNPGPRTNSVATCPPPGSGCKPILTVHKDTNHVRTAGEQISHVINTRACYESDPVPTNNTC